ncbi:MBL fold metallo-hydrolase [Albidovulum sediminicola]|uniref:MBL fold metallo-hydrolase n=1 Tax=Albidovulum sediminicola TaxID=2984331 RepID=A0ABT2YXK3_9RHOB|nr:MBL fold metallo-hydrolase [Defluviimonas sp. WL0075]MCV2863606.1 MBL fold metallo-hydrolase [Defluviimonas sp. WL0075]
MLTRRHFIAATGAAFALPAPRLWAASTLDLGGARIDTLSDGFLTLPADFILGGMPEAEVQEITARYGVAGDQLTPPCNVTLWRDGTNTVLFDLGSGPDFQPTAGKLAEAMEALGLTVEDVTHVVFTHGHPDHLWGLLDEFDDPVFPNAEHSIGGAEFDYWTDPETVDTIGAARTTFAVGAARRLGAVADNLRRLSDGEEVLPGLFARLTPGHTPGHMSFDLTGGSVPVTVIGDAIGNHHVGFERPDWASGSDQDKDLAASTRVALLDRMAADEVVLIGYHLPDGGIGRAERAGAGYRFIPEV